MMKPNNSKESAENGKENVKSKNGNGETDNAASKLNVVIRIPEKVEDYRKRAIINRIYDILAKPPVSVHIAPPVARYDEICYPFSRDSVLSAQ